MNNFITVPPHAKELEENVIGTCLVFSGAFDIVSEILTAECFYTENAKIIYQTVVDLVKKGVVIDILTVSRALGDSGKLEQVGGIFYITKITNDVTTTVGLEDHCRIILQKHLQRELMRIGGEIVNRANDNTSDVFDLIGEAEESVYKLSTNFFKSDFIHISSGLVKTISRIDELMNKQEEVSGVPSGYKCIDRVTYGWQPTDLIILAARPSVGKTAFALNIARNAALNFNKPTPIGFFSLEMSSSQLLNRMISAESKIRLDKISRGKLEDFEYQQLMTGTVRTLEKAPIFIDDKASLNLFELRSKARRMVNKHKVGLIIIDYLQLMDGRTEKGMNREQEISNLSRSLKKLAKELNIPIIALSQLSRKIEDRGVRVPQLSDLRESGAIEQDADMVMFLYGPSEAEAKEDIELSNKRMVKIAKHRNGSLESFTFEVDNSIQLWEEIGVLNDFPKRTDNFRTPYKDDPF